MYSKFLDPKNDLTFKKVFGQHPHLLKSFLNALLPLTKGSFIETLEYLPAEMVPENPLMKHSIVDVRCKDNFGRQFIVEMQMHWTTAFMQRVLFNASKAYVRQMDKSYQYSILEPVYALSLVNEIFQPKKETYYHHYQIVNVADTEQQIEGLEFVFIELPKFKAKNLTEKKLQVLWLRFMTEIDEKTADASPDLLSNQEISEAIESVRTSAFSPAEMEAYDKYWDIVRTEKTLYAGYFEKGIKKGKALGQALGRVEGRAEGKAEGRAEGRAEGELLIACKTALRGISRNMSRKDIMELTDISDNLLDKLFAVYEKYKSEAINHIEEIID